MELQSKLIASLVGEPEPGHRLTVLDIGPADPETVTFFSQFKCRLHFCDLFSEQILHEQRDELEEKELARRFIELLDFPADTKFDICLFWDIFDYLDNPAIDAFNAALRPFIHTGTRAHGFGSMNGKTIIPNQSYGLKSVETLQIKQVPDRQLMGYPHPQAELKKILSDFDIRKGILMSDGRLEMLMHSVAV